jgi:hypothetical protein
VHASPEVARLNVDQLSRRVATVASLNLDGDWADLLDDVQSRADGRVLLATLRGWTTLYWEKIALDESLLWHTGSGSID